MRDFNYSLIVLSMLFVWCIEYIIGVSGEYCISFLYSNLTMINLAKGSRRDFVFN